MRCLKLSEVWNYLNQDLKRAIRSAAIGRSRIRTRSLLGAMAALSDEAPGSQIIRNLQKCTGVEFESPNRMTENTEPAPEDVDLSPCVQETLNFFRHHQIRSVNPADLASRLLQIGTGSTVRSLEREGILNETIERLDEVR